MSSKYSVVTVCKNSEATIRQTIESVIYQTFDNWEYIIIDGASKDATIDIIKEYIEEFPEKIKFVSEPDSGIYDAMNKGIRMATGDFVAVLNSDDYYERNALREIENNVSTREKTVYYAMQRTIKNSAEESCSILSHKFLPDRMIWHEACFVSKDIYDELGVYNTEYKASADYDFFLKLFFDKNISFYPVYAITTNFRTGGFSSTYVGAVEENRVKKKYGLISNKEYMAKCIFNKGKHSVGILK